MTRQWLVDQIAKDFVQEDVWQFPIVFKPEHHFSLAQFRDRVLQPAMNRLQSQGLSGFLFRFRQSLGKTFGWDLRGGCNQESLRERYLRLGGCPISVDCCEESPFQMVYSFENESLSEICNRTIHAALHLSWEQQGNEGATVVLRVYVKKINFFSGIYMAMINPFRKTIIYPTMMNLAKREWTEYLNKADLTQGAYRRNVALT